MGFVKKNVIQKFVRKHKWRTSKALYEAIDAQVEQMILKGGARADYNGRTTITDRDI